jgi:hypothetical protein
LEAQSANGSLPDSVSTPTAVTSQSPAPSPQAVSVSGVLYQAYQYGGPRNIRSENRFDLDRAYLNVRAANGTRDSIRVTLDVFQQRDASRDEYYRGWTMRAKYAYLNHDFVSGSGDALRVFARLGLIQTVMIEKEEQFWNRGLSPVAAEQAGFFNSADAGAAVGITLPDRSGEIYATVMNGSGYTSRETDRYKDFQARLTLTPWANGSGPLRGLQLSPWVSIGGRASDFVAGKGTVLPVAAAQRKHRYGFLATYRDPRLVLGAHFGRRLETAETADTTRDITPATRDVTGHLTSVFGFWRPLATSSTSSPWSLLVRVDHIRPDDATPGAQRRYIVGSTWEVSNRTSVTFDVQSLSPRNGLSGVPSRTFFMHIISNF